MGSRHSKVHGQAPNSGRSNHSSSHRNPTRMRNAFKLQKESEQSREQKNRGNYWEIAGRRRAPRGMQNVHEGSKASSLHNRPMQCNLLLLPT